MSKPESTLRQRIRTALRYAFNCDIYSNVGSAYSGSGVHDLTVAVGGKFLGLEIETSTGTLTPAQQRRIRKCNKRGNPAAPITSPREALNATYLVFNDKWNFELAENDDFSFIQEPKKGNT